MGPYGWGGREREKKKRKKKGGGLASMYHKQACMRNRGLVSLREISPKLVFGSAPLMRVCKRAGRSARCPQREAN